MGFRRVSRGLFFGPFIAGAAVSAVIVAMPVAVAAPQVSSLAIKAADAAFSGSFSDASDLAQRSGDPAASKPDELIYLRDHWRTAGYRRIIAFLDAAPNWPLSETLLKRAEYSLYLDNAPTATVLEHFAARVPLSAEGKLALARAVPLPKRFTRRPDSITTPHGRQWSERAH